MPFLPPLTPAQAGVPCGSFPKSLNPVPAFAGMSGVY